MRLQKLRHSCHMPAIVALYAAGAAVALATDASAQVSPAGHPRVEITIGVGWGRVWRWESHRRFGQGLTVGGGVTVRGTSGWAAAISADHTFGPPASPTTVTANLQYFFRGDEHVQPYLSAGLGALVTKTLLRDATATDVGLGPNLGAGLRVSGNGRVAARTEVQWLEGSWRSPLNLSVTRLTAGAGVRR
jgi:hypothetical protein